MSDISKDLFDNWLKTGPMAEIRVNDRTKAIMQECWSTAWNSSLENQGPPDKIIPVKSILGSDRESKKE